MEKYINERNKEVFKGVELDSLFDSEMFHLVTSYVFEDNIQHALHTNLGSFTVLDRTTGFGYRDIETGYRDPQGKFWLASGGYDVRGSGAATFKDAIESIKNNANNCIGYGI